MTITGPAGLAVASAGTTTLGADSALFGNVVSVGNVTLNARANVQGNVTTQASFFHQTPYTIAGTLSTSTSVSPLFDQVLTVEYPASSTPLNVEPNQVVSASPGAYTSLNLKGGSKLPLSPGDYFFDSATLESLSELHVSDATRPVVLHVKDQFTMRGSLPDARAQNVLWIVSGTSGVEIGAPLTGTVIAPNADVRLGPTNGGPHHGAVFAKSVAIEAQSPFQLVPFSGWEQLLRPITPPDAAPSAAFRARWVYPNGQPIESFSYGPAPSGIHALALGQPGEAPTTSLSFEIQRLNERALRGRMRRAPVRGRWIEIGPKRLTEALDHRKNAAPSSADRPRVPTTVIGNVAREVRTSSKSKFDVGILISNLRREGL